MPGRDDVRDARSGHRRLRPLSGLRALLALTTVVVGCDGTGRVVEIDAGGFVDVGEASDAAAADTGGGAGGCTLRQPVPCDGSGCCDPSVPRCVPSLGGTNRCVEGGDLQRGAACGADGTDACGVNLLCVVEATGSGTCVETCGLDADCAEGTCTSVSTAVGAALLCTPG